MPDLNYYQKLALYKTSMFADFLKCVDIAGPRNVLGKMHTYAIACKLANHYLDKIVQHESEFGECQLGPEIIMISSPDEAAMMFIHWIMVS